MSKEKLNIVISDQSNIKVKDDINIKIYIGDIPNPYYTEYDDSYLLGDEYIEGEFLGIDEFKLEETYKGPDFSAKDEVQDNDTERGSYYDDDLTFTNKKANNLQISYIKESVNTTGSYTGGRCARYTFNHANNYCLKILGRKLSAGAIYAAGGNAKQSGYHNNLERLGYIKYDKGTMDKNSIINFINSQNWDIGDVIVYWGISAWSLQGGVLYGHTQIFTGGYHNNSNYNWSSDKYNNYETGFVYRKYNVDTWRLLIFKAPQPSTNLA